MSNHASGTFDVELKPLPLSRGDDQPLLGRRSLDKTFHGELEATSRGEMLSAGTAVKGSAGYVAIELVTAKLDGKSGSFVLQHSGTMTRGAAGLSVHVVPDSGTGELSRIRGSMSIKIEDGKHFYEFDYSFE